jgi:pilus assembly protein CpaB
MRTKSIALLVLALGCGLVASIGITQVMANRDADSADAGDMIEVFVAGQPIQVNERLSSQVVKLVKRPKDTVPEGALSSLQEIEGRVSKTEIVENDLILDSKLLDKNASARKVTWRITKGYRVMPVKVSYDTVNTGILQPGDRVDVMVIIPMKNSGTGTRSSLTRTFLQNVKVFAVGSDYEIVPSEEKGRSMAMKTVSLLVTPEQAEIIASASDAGTIKLTLRGMDDEGLIESEGVTPEDILQVTESGKRDDETLMDEPAEEGPSKLDKLRDMLAQIRMAQQAEPETAQPEPTALANNWRMRILAGSMIDEVIFDEQGERVSNEPGTPAPAPARGHLPRVHSTDQPPQGSLHQPQQNPPEEALPTDEPRGDD